MKHGLQLAGITLLWLVGLKIYYRLGLPSDPLHYGITWPLGIPTIFQTSVTVPLHSLNGRHLGCARELWNSLAKIPWKQHPTQLVMQGPRACLNIKTVFPVMGIFITEFKQSWDCLIFKMRIPILVRQHLYIETGPRTLWTRVEPGY